MVDVKKFADTDLYGLLGIDIGAQESEVSELILYCYFINIL